MPSQKFRVWEVGKPSAGRITGHSETVHMVAEAAPDRIDRLLAGTVEISAAPTPENTRLFAPFRPQDREQAAGGAALYMKIAERVGGVPGLRAAVDRMYEDLPKRPLGMVEHAAKLFLTHYPLARNVLRMRRLEERQPEAVRPSNS